MKKRRKFKVVEKPAVYEVIPESEEYDFKTSWHTTHSKEEAEKICNKLNSEHYISDYTCEELKKFYNDIDWNGLIEELKTKLKINYIAIEEKNLDAALSVYYQYQFEFTVILHTNLCETYEILKLFFYSCTLKADSSDCFDVDKTTGELFFKTNLFFEAKKYDLSTTYIPFLTATYSNTTKKWKFEYAKDIFKH